MGDGLYQVMTYANWSEPDVLCADLVSVGVHEEQWTVTTSCVELLISGMSQFRAWFDLETERPVGLVTGRMKEVWGETTAYPTTEFPETEYPTTQYLTTEFLSDIDSGELSNETINNQQTIINMKTSVINETTTAVSPTRTRNTMANRVRGTDTPRMGSPPYPTYYPDTEYPTRFPDCQFFTYMPDTLWYRDKEEEEKEECHLVTAEIVVEFEGEEGLGEDVVNNGVSALGDGPLTAEMILDGKDPEVVQVTNPRINVYRMDLLKWYTGKPPNSERET